MRCASHWSIIMTSWVRQIFNSGRIVYYNIRNVSHVFAFVFFNHCIQKTERDSYKRTRCDFKDFAVISKALPFQGFSSIGPL